MDVFIYLESRFQFLALILIGSWILLQVCCTCEFMPKCIGIKSWCPCQVIYIIYTCCILVWLRSHYILAANWYSIRGWVGVFEWKCQEIHLPTSSLSTAVFHWKVSKCPPFSYWSCWKDVNIWSATKDYWWVNYAYNLVLCQ